MIKIVTEKVQDIQEKQVDREGYCKYQKEMVEKINNEMKNIHEMK